jgi:hypothetical protein
MSAGDLFLFRASKSGDAYTFFVEIMDEPKVGLEFRVLAARELLKHQRQADPPLLCPVPLIEPQCAADAEHNVMTINYYEATARVGPAAAAALRQGQKDWLETHVMSTIQHEARTALKTFSEMKPVLDGLGITAVGGLPELPGASIVMPTANKPWAGNKDKDEGKS